MDRGGGADGGEEVERGRVDEHGARGRAARPRGAEGRHDGSDPADRDAAPESPSHGEADGGEAEGGPHRDAHTTALADLRTHRLVTTGGPTSAGEVLRHLTLKGLEAAATELQRPLSEMGATARGAGAAGASHPMTVNKTVIGLLRPKPDLAKLATDPPAVRAAAQAVVDAPGGVGSIGSYLPEVALPVAGSWSTPGRGGAQADIVLTAPQDNIPLLFVEVDNCHETAEEFADKQEKYARFYRRKVKDTVGKAQPMWRTRWNTPPGTGLENPYPPVLFVFNPLGARNPERTIARLAALTRHPGTRTTRRTSTTTAGRSPSSRPPWPTSGSTVRMVRSSVASAAPVRRCCSTRSVAPAVRPPWNATGPSSGPVSARPRSVSARRPNSARWSGKRSARRVRGAGRSSPTNGGRRPRPPTGELRRTPPTLCDRCKHRALVAVQLAQTLQHRSERHDQEDHQELARMPGRWFSRRRT
ncbi:replication-relaxation family protein [Streptomyces sp. NBC_00523]|uniref:replication-relaxation family protein n=1 Tax=Streptomyces sp. NBC_00523 TaxID=2975765 RepID=UPI002E7FCCE6|nr:replication-relaxation family protein [Streptomyces sp. NBC_00523]WUC98337.1 replication-relaxation family protein [Streptomyces sp. NBC_00523]